MPKFITTKYYEKKLSKFLERHPSMLKKYQKTIKILGTNPCHPSLRLHKLKAKISDLQSLSINMKYRIVLNFIIKDDIIILIDIGGHGEVY